MHFRKTIGLSAVTAIALLALGAGVASAHTTSFRSTVEMTWHDDPGSRGGRFEGTLASPRAACLDERTVKLFRVDTEPNQLVTSTSTNSLGDWVVFVGGVDWDGTYAAKVVRKDLVAGRRHNHICRADRSPDLPVQDEVT